MPGTVKKDPTRTLMKDNLWRSWKKWSGGVYILAMMWILLWTLLLGYLKIYWTLWPPSEHASWVSKGTLQKIKSRNQAQQVASQTGLQADWEAYKQLRNQVTSLLRKDKQVWHQSKLASCEESNDSAKLWKNVLGWLNWSSTSSPTKLLNEGNLETSPKKLAEIQNKFMSRK